MSETPITFQEVFDSFESSFQDKCIVSPDLEALWLKKAVAQFSVEIDPIQIDLENEVFITEIDQYVIDTLAQMMKVYYQERELSKVNKRVSIVTKALSIDGNGNAKSAAKNELDYNEMKRSYMIFNQKPTAYN